MESKLHHLIEKFRPSVRNLEDIRKEKETYWDGMSDRVAAIGGSWPFIFGFMATLVAWMLLNSDILAHWNMAFDPYPYIFLNLMLSMLAAVQAPIIMMSQNRQAAKDRLAAQNDYDVNLRAELSILSLHEKIDALRIAELEALVRQQGEMIKELQNKENPPNG